MKRFYELKYSAFLQKELRRLENGNQAEKQRFRQTQTTIAKIQSDPLSNEFQKNLPENYKAADILQQYRLFFKIYDVDDNTDIIFLTWMNDESSIHRSGQKDDAYEVFRKLLGNGEIEKYTPPPPSNEPIIMQHNNWGDPVLYFDLKQQIEEKSMWAKSHLYINKINDPKWLAQFLKELF